MFFCVPSIIENKNENVVTIQEKEVVDEDRVENINEEEIQKEEKIETKAEDDHFLKNVEDINLHDIDGKGTNYIFTYREEDFSAKFVKDTWHITDSYKIRNEKDLAIICQALIDIHPIPSSDGTSYRTVEDLVYEWKQHNIAYILLLLDPLLEMLAARVGQHVHDHHGEGHYHNRADLDSAPDRDGHLLRHLAVFSHCFIPFLRPAVLRCATGDCCSALLRTR